MFRLGPLREIKEPVADMAKEVNIDLGGKRRMIGREHPRATSLREAKVKA
jgi:hypothetical protein